MLVQSQSTNAMANPKKHLVVWGIYPFFRICNPSLVFQNPRISCDWVFRPPQGLLRTCLSVQTPTHKVSGRLGFLNLEKGSLLIKTLALLVRCLKKVQKIFSHMVVRLLVVYHAQTKRINLINRKLH